MKEKSLLQNALIACFAVLLFASTASAVPATSPEESTVMELPRLEAYADQTYMIAVYRTLERKVSNEPEFAKDWAFTRFVIDRNGKIEKGSVTNSTGNEKFDAEVVRILHETHLPPLPEDCPDKVRATHAFNYHRATRDVARAGAAERNRESANVAQSPGKFQSTGGETTVEAETAKIKNNLGMTNWLIFFYTLFLLSFLSGGAFLAFFVAVPVWYLHRLFLGRFPA